MRHRQLEEGLNSYTLRMENNFIDDAIRGDAGVNAAKYFVQNVSLYVERFTLSRQNPEKVAIQVLRLSPRELCCQKLWLRMNCR